MRIAVIGAGSIGTRHIKNALALGHHVAVFDTDTERLKAAIALGAHRYVVIDTTTFTQPKSAPLLQHVDAMMVCTPYNRHLTWAQWAVDEKIPLFIEKPLGSLDQIEDWRRLAQASASLVTQVGYQCRFHEKYRTMREWCEPARSGGFYTDCDMRTWPGKSYGDPLLEMSHDLDLALAAGAPTRVDAVTVDGSTWNFWLGENERWLMSFDSQSKSYRRHWALNGPSADIVLRFDSPEELGDQMYLDELRHFLECVQTGRQTDVPLKDGLRVLDVVKQVEEMARQHA